MRSIPRVHGLWSQMEVHDLRPREHPARVDHKGRGICSTWAPMGWAWPSPSHINKLVHIAGLVGSSLAGSAFFNFRDDGSATSPSDQQFGVHLRGRPQQLGPGVVSPSVCGLQCPELSGLQVLSSGFRGPSVCNLQCPELSGLQNLSSSFSRSICVQPSVSRPSRPLQNRALRISGPAWFCLGRGFRKIKLGV